MYIGGIDNIAHKVKKIYIGGLDGVAKKVKKIYIGDASNLARIAWSGSAKILFNRINSNDAAPELASTDNDFATITTVSSESNAYELFYKDGYIYRMHINKLSNTSWTYTWQRKKMNDSTWSNIKVVSTGDNEVLVSYNPDEKVFVFVQFTAKSKHESFGYSVGMSYLFTDGITVPDFTWYRYVSNNTDRTFWSAPMYKAGDGLVMFLRLHWYNTSGSARTYHQCHTYHPSTGWRIIEDSTTNGASSIEDHRSFNGYYLGFGATVGSFLNRSIISSSPLITSTKVTLPVYGENSDKMFWHGVVGNYYYFIGFSTTNKTVYTMRSADGVNFTLLATLVVTDKIYATFFLGHDGSDYYFGFDSFVSTGLYKNYFLKANSTFSKIELLASPSSNYRISYSGMNNTHFNGVAES